MSIDSSTPLQDLNLPPQSTTSTSTAITDATSTMSKKVKIEPLDEPPHTGTRTQTQTQTGTCIQTPCFLPIMRPHIPSNTSTSDEPNVSAGFDQVSATCHEGFAPRMQCEDDVSVLGSSQAIVPFSNTYQNSNDDDAPGSSNSIVSPSQTRRHHGRRLHRRSGELVRVTNVGLRDENHFRSTMRRTRMTYSALRLQVMEEEERLREMPRNRADLRAAKLMRNAGLWLNRDKRIVGAIPGVSIGDVFLWWTEMCVVGLHGQLQAGIDYLSAGQSSNGEPVATSVIVSGGYEDDDDGGEVVIYTGQGGRDKNGRQCMHQKLEGGNLALERSMHHEIEIRVVRGLKYEGSATGKVYVYDGLYNVVDSWFDVGKSGFGVYKFMLRRIENQPEMGSVVLKFAEELRNSPLTVRPRGYISLDISRKKENVPVLLFNDVDDERDPDYFDYLTTSVFPPYVYGNVGNGQGCDCVGGCVDGCFCVIKNGGEFAYDSNGILMRGRPLIFECGPHCCCPQTCRNRLTQKGVRSRFEVFRSRETNWGVRSLDLIQAGAFICEFAGVVLTHQQAQIFAMNGDNLVYPSRFPDRWAEWGDLLQIYPDYVRPSCPSIRPLDFAMDVSNMRNVACYVSHSSTPNAFVQLVLYDHNNVSYPHLMLFALENIPPLREISIDYGVPDDWTGKPTVCN